jgi:triacylglycerol esterase/lipase EstA (alpha/beta hydrolase family)
MSAMLRNSEVESRGESTSLVVVVHGFIPSARFMDGLHRRIRELDENADLLAPRWRWFSLHDPTDVAEALVECISRAVRQQELSGKAYRRIVLVGHSSGTLLLRKAFSYACGHYEDGPRRPQLRPRESWVDRVERIVLLAGMNRGWSLSPRPQNMLWLKWLALRALAFGLGLVSSSCRRARRSSSTSSSNGTRWR